MQILGKEIKVEMVEDRTIITNNGACSSDRCVIQVLSILPEDKKNEVILHEMIHILSNELEIGLSEKQTKRLGVGLYAVLKENGNEFKLTINN